MLDLFAISWTVYGACLVGVGFIGFARFANARDKARPGDPSFVPPFFWQFIGLVILFVAGAEFLSQFFGISWTPPIRG